MNLANKITLSRIAMVPVFLFFLLADYVPYNDYISTFLFILAASTDGLDGYIARKRKQITNFGKFMDPIADKLLVTAALISLVGLGKLDSWMVIVIIGREFIVTGFRIIAITEGKVIAASMWGKVKTVSQIVAIVALLMDDFFTIQLGLVYGPFKFTIFIMWVAVIFTIYSGYDYIVKNRDVLNMNDK